MLNDPRCYTADFPQTNLLINLALSAQDTILDATIAKLLQEQKDEAINVAINLAPSHKVSFSIWQSLNRVINDAEVFNLNNCFTQLFTIPIVIVAGSKQQQQLQGQIEVTVLNDFFYQQQIVSKDTDFFISGKLLDYQTIASFKPSQIFYWSRNINKSSLWLPIKVEGNVIDTLNEGVFLRYLVGAIVSNSKQLSIDYQNLQQNLLKLTQLIHQQLNIPNVTFFPICYQPVALSNAAQCGNQYRLEIALSVAFSNIVKQIRTKNLTPIAVISNTDEAIKIIIKTQTESDLKEESLWTLNRVDDFNQILKIITDLLNDIGVEIKYA
ncbi:MAG: hypothetical protein ORN24_07055 [Burkholderiales bacterium]|jgi:hypothetical protein|nr:hypothetical protein [Burkholderiales bacterium]